jgi:hypothetical protein
MGIATRVAASAAVALAAQAANAGFVYSASNREVSIAVSGAIVDSDVFANAGSWFGSANASGAGFSALSTQGSDLAALAMTFVGASQIEASATASIAGRSTADVTFIADSTESISWIASLGRSASGAGNSGSISLSIVDVTTGGILLAFSGPSNGSGSVDVVAGNTYRLQIAALANANGAGSVVSNYNVGLFSAIPAPATLVAFAGLLVGSRRRR